MEKNYSYEKDLFRRISCFNYEEKEKWISTVTDVNVAVLSDEI